MTTPNPERITLVVIFLLCTAFGSIIVSLLLIEDNTDRIATALERGDHLKDAK